jgi:hypothetical protein
MNFQTLNEADLRKITASKLRALSTFFHLPYLTRLSKREVLNGLEKDSRYWERLLSLGTGRTYIEQVYY